MTAGLLRVRRLLVTACVAVAAVPALASGASAVDTCSAFNGVRYESPAGASVAQYVGVAGACAAADNGSVSIQVVPVGGSRDAPIGGSAAGGQASPSTGQATGAVGPEGSAPAPSPRPSTRTGSPGTDTASREVVARALSKSSSAGGFAGIAGLGSLSVAVPALVALALVGAGLGLRRRLR